MHVYIYTYINPAGIRLFRLYPEDTHSSTRTHIQSYTPSHAAAAARGCSSNLRVHVPKTKKNNKSYSAQHVLVCLCVFG